MVKLAATPVGTIPCFQVERAWILVGSARERNNMRSCATCQLAMRSSNHNPAALICVEFNRLLEHWRCDEVFETPVFVDDDFRAGNLLVECRTELRG